MAAPTVGPYPLMMLTTPYGQAQRAEKVSAVSSRVFVRGLATHRGEAGLLDQVAHPQGGKGGEFTGLQDNNVSGGQSGTDLPREHQHGEL
jgi:hypothetical protein